MTQAAFSWSTDDKSNRSRVLTLLQSPQGQWRSTLELQAVGGSRAGARVHELRGAGWLIECRGQRGRYEYRLTGKGDAQRHFTLADLYTIDRLFRGCA
jgi:hypothetical protein